MANLERWESSNDVHQVGRTLSETLKRLKSLAEA